jgi:RHS repeat-associated protein
LIQETVWLGDTPVATLRPGTPVRIFYVHADHLNTPRKVTRPSDNAARWTWESDPFGVALPNESPDSLDSFEYNLRFPGQIYDPHTKLMYNYFRDYDAVTGRYIQSDPIGLVSGTNTYAYVGGNPILAFDERGLDSRTLCLNPANLPACVAAGEITAAQAAAIRAAALAAAKRAAILAGMALLVDDCLEEDCRKEVEACSELCAAAQVDPDRQHVYGGSMSQCMKNCLPERCGGEPTWKGFK